MSQSSLSRPRTTSLPNRSRNRSRSRRPPRLRPSQLTTLQYDLTRFTATHEPELTRYPCDSSKQVADEEPRAPSGKGRLFEDRDHQPLSFWIEGKVHPTVRTDLEGLIKVSPSLAELSV